MPIANPNYFTGNPLQRLSEKRGNVDWLQEQLAHPQAGLVPFWQGMPLLAATSGGAPPSACPLWLSPAARGEFSAEATLVLLGLRPGPKGAVPCFALDATQSAVSAAQAPFADMGQYTPLREAAGQLARDDLAIMGQAAWLLDWHRRHGFCPQCGERTKLVEAGAKRDCAACEAEYFPRTDPVAIVLVVEGDHCLLGRSSHFPPGMFSALAGFLEAGETLEECAVREIHEEAGVVISDLRYVFSQPWPFPASLMVGFIAKAQSRALTLDPTEITDAKWVSRADMRKLLGGGQLDGIFVPPPFAIAHQLLRNWVEEET